MPSPFPGMDPYLLKAPEEEVDVIRPEVLVARRRDAAHAAEGERTGVSTLEPVAVPS